LAEKPTAAFVLSLIGGIFMLIGGIIVASVGAIFTSVIGGVGVVLGLVGVVFAVIVIVGSIMLYSNPGSHTIWGVIILILSIIDLPGVWGIGIGSLLAFIGAILALVFKPSMMPNMMPGQPMGSYPMGAMGPMGAAPPPPPMGGQMNMFCKNCGASLPAGAARCPSCGASVM
jgi:zinc-ribbon domain